VSDQEDSRSCDSDGTVSGPYVRPSSIPTNVSAPHRVRQTEECRKTVSELSILIHASVIIGSTIAAGIASLLLSTHSLRMFNLDEGILFQINCAIAGALMGSAVGNLVGKLAVANFFRTLIHNKIAIAANANAAKRAAKRGRDACDTMFVVAGLLIFYVAGKAIIDWVFKP
jgi:hypothetical protein